MEERNEDEKEKMEGKIYNIIGRKVGEENEEKWGEWNEGWGIVSLMKMEE